MHVVDVDNGARFETYTIPGERGSGDMRVNGAAARLVHQGDTIIVISYGQYDEADLERYTPRVVHVEANTNRIVIVDEQVATLLGCSSPSERQPEPSERKQAMSSHPTIQAPSDPGRLPMTLPLLAEKKRLGEPIVMVTAYDYPSARAAEAAGVDLVLVGDSAATTVLGYNATTPVELEDMLVLTRAARRGLTHAAADRRPAVRLLRGLRRAGDHDRDAHGQGGRLRRRQARGRRRDLRQPRPRDRRRRYPGDGPRRPHAADLDRARRLEGAGSHRQPPPSRIASEALALQEAGCFALVFEAIPSAVTDELMGLIEIPVIGIGAGPATDGQVLVFHDLLGIRDGLGARFVKRYANLQQEMNDGVSAYAEDVRSRRYPGPEHTYKIDPAELAELQAQLSHSD